MAERSLGSIGYVFRAIIRPRLGLLLIGLALIIVNRAAGLVLPGSTKYFVDTILAAGDLDRLNLLLLAVGGVVILQSVTSFALTRLLSVEAQHLIARLRIRVQQHIIRLPVGYFDDHKSGELVSRIMHDVEGVRNLVGTGLVQLIGGLLTSVASLAIMIYINPLLTAVTLLPMIIFVIIAVSAFRYLRPIFRKRGEIQAEVTGRLTESLGGIRVIRGFNAEKSEMNVFRKGVDRIFRNVRQTLTATALVMAVATMLIGLTSCTIMYLSGHAITAGTMTVGDFFAFTLYLGFMITPIVQMSNIGTQITEAFAGLDRMEEVLSKKREEDDPGRTVTLENVGGDIVFNDVRFAYGESADVLHGISFTAPAGSVTALVGSSGSGKTTIAGLAASFLRPGSGSVTVDGTDLATVQLDSFRRRLAVVLQDDFLFDGSIRDNILFGRPDASEGELAAAVEAAHVKEFSDRFPDKLDTVIGERGVKLSGGQRQRVAIARAVIADPAVLILDEATSSLDMESEAYIQESLAALMENRTTFVIAHRLSTIRKAHQILVIEGGCIVEQGTHEELIKREGRYHHLYTYQARI